MIFAFDYNGTTQKYAVLREMARLLIKANHECHIISAIGNSGAEAACRDDINSWGIAWTGIHFVLFPRPLEVGGVVEYEIGQLKANVMRAVGAAALYDDNPYICRAVRDAGFLAFQV